MGKKIHRCHYCKELLDINNDNIITFEMGKKTIKEVEAHDYCRQPVINRKEFYDWLLKILDVPSVDKYTVMSLDSLQKSGYNWDVIKHAVRTKLKTIQDNFSKGMAYMCGIIRNQCPISYKEYKKEEELKQYQECFKKQVEDSKYNKVKIINITKKEETVKDLISLEDISTL